MKILFIAPIPPPITGHSIASKVFLDALNLDHDVILVNLSKDSLAEGVNGFDRIFAVLRMLRTIALVNLRADIVYLTISESLAGNLKDLCIYLLCFIKRKNTFIHLHGASIKTLLWDKYPLLRTINKFFINKLGGVIILGETHRNIFSGMVDPKKIFVIPNFSQDFLFMNETDIRKKFLITKKVNILFLSNMLPLKGFKELAMSYFKLPSELKEQIEIDFAGIFDSQTEEQNFMELISKTAGITYHGVVNGDKKKALLAKAHVFCLPTSYFEGQPISILESYASGCVVLSTDKGGILDIFEPTKNGFLIEERDDASVVKAIIQAFSNKDKWVDIAMNNHRCAIENYRVSVYIENLKQILK